MSLFFQREFNLRKCVQEVTGPLSFEVALNPDLISFGTFLFRTMSSVETDIDSFPLQVH